jgi:hypothetical protein
MKRLFNYLRKLPVSMRKLVSIDSQQTSLLQYFNIKRAQSARSQDVVLVQSVEDLFYFGLFGQIVTSLREQHPIRVEQFVLRSLNVGEAKSIWVFAKSRLIINTLLSYKWKRLHQSFCDGIAYSSTSFRPLSDLVDLYRAWACWNRLNTKKALIDLVIDYVLVGDLVNDSFLRFKPAATVRLSDTYLLILLWQAYRDVRRAKKYFTRVKPKLYLTSYSTYIQHGVAVRVALQCGVRVFSFGNYQEFAKELSLPDWVHTKNPDAYSDEFLKMNLHEEKLATADAALSSRMAGIIDNATAYMKKSAYAVSSNPVPNVHGAVIIFLHDFFDSPHVYRDMVFPDFWEWVCFTIDTLKKHNIPFFVKPHPNQINLSDSVLDELKQRYPELLEIPSSITNKQLAEAGMACAVTVYGTVAHEMAYLGVPTIACAHHPHISFDICKTAKSKEEYAEILQSYTDINIDKSKLRQQSLAFYYMHNININDEERNLRDKVWGEFSADCNGNEEHSNVVKILNEISALPAYKAHILKWLAAIYGGKGIVEKHKSTQSPRTSLF